MTKDIEDIIREACEQARNNGKPLPTLQSICDDAGVEITPFARTVYGFEATNHNAHTLGNMIKESINI